MKLRLGGFHPQVLALGLVVVGLIWAAAIYEIRRTYEITLREAELRTATQAQVFAEYSRSTIKRINEVALGLRESWHGNWQAFAEDVKRSQVNIDDVTFQVAIIDRDGLLAFSNLAKTNDRTDLSGREHFQVHKAAPQADQLFISRPLLGKVSGKWSIQVTRPLLRNGEFDGVIVISLSPTQFANFAEKLRIRPSSALTVVRDTGEIMARFPSNEQGLGVILTDRPFLGPQAPLSGTYRQVSRVDGQDRLWGFQRIPEYGMSFVIGEALADIEVEYGAQKRPVLLAASIASLLAAALFLALARSLGANEEVKRQLSEILLLSPDAFISFDENRRVKYLSPPFAQMTGLDSALAVGLDEVAFVRQLNHACTPKSGLPPLEDMRRAAAGAAAREGSGNTRPLRYLIELSGPAPKVLEAGLKMSSARTVSQILYFRDVTHETEVDRMKSEFLSTAAHELRTPMASIYGFSEVLLTQDNDPEMTRDLVQTIHRQSELMASIINELLDLARIEARRGKDFVLERLDLRELIQESAEGYKVPEGRESPRITPIPEPLLVFVDCKKMQQALGNLLSNAYKYSPDGGAVEIHFRLDWQADEPRVGVCVTDHGIGMTPAQAARVCERFYRSDTSGKIPGTGLGMSIVKEIVELHRGSVEIDSAPGEGTRVTLWVPVAPEHATHG